jgi:hypothetical protein
MAKSTDGRHWHAVPVPDAKVSTNCIDIGDCVSHIRFASATVGYSFGPETMFVTHDGGADWTRGTGGAEAIEALDGNVIRVVSSGSGCPGPCLRWIETAPIGGPRWSTAQFQPPKMTIGGVSFARTGSRAYLLVIANPAGGAGRATSRLYVSGDDGHSWADMGEPCPQLRGGGEVDSTSLNTAPDGTVLVGCMQRQAPNRISVAESADGGHSFIGRPAFSQGLISAVAAATDKSVLARSDRLFASIDGGEHFHLVSQGPEHPTWLGFETSTTGHAVEQSSTGDGASILWTTRNAGQTWTSYQFP